MTARFLVGDVFEQLATLEDGSVDLVLSSPPFLALRSYLPADHVDKGKEIGSEATPGEFLDTILDVVEECARVLAPHGSLVFEFGDTYASDGGTAKAMTFGNPKHVAEFTDGRASVRAVEGWPLAKSLTLIPESFAWALAYGRNPFTGRETDPWRIRNFCPWVRPNPPVGALGDKFRPGTSYLTVACKARDRWFDLDAVRTEYKKPDAYYVRRDETYANTSNKGTMKPYDARESAGAPPLDWFNIPTQPYAGSHYATWPERLALPFIESMCPRHVCTICGLPRRRLTSEPEYEALRQPFTENQSWGNSTVGMSASEAPAARHVETLGWSECACRCGRCLGCDGADLDPVPKCRGKWRSGVTLDPFAGSGTTLQVATGCGRDAIGIDLDSRNLELARARIGMFLVEEEPPRPVEDVVGL